MKHFLMKLWVVVNLLSVMGIFSSGCAPVSSNGATLEPSQTKAPATILSEPALPSPIVSLSPAPSDHWDVSNVITLRYDRIAMGDHEKFYAGGSGGRGGFVYIGDVRVDMDFPTITGFLGGLTAIDVVSNDDAWAAFFWGQIFHWDGNQWNSMELPLVMPGHTNFTEIEFSDANYGWAVGRYDEALILLQWDGKKWSDVSQKLGDKHRHLLADASLRFPLEVVSDRSVWIGGGNVIVHWDGAVWSQIPTPEDMQGVRSISVFEDGQIWALSHTDPDEKVINETMFHWDGREWSRMQVLSYTPDSSDAAKMVFLSTDDGWLVSNSLFHWNGKEWEDMAYEAQHGLIADIDKSPDGKVWALTETGSLLELEYSE